MANSKNFIQTPLGTLPSLGSMGVEDLFSFTENPNSVGGVTPMPSVEPLKPVTLSPAADEAVKALLKGPDLSYAEKIRQEQERASAERLKAAEARAEAARKAQNAAHTELMRYRAEQAKERDKKRKEAEKEGKAWGAGDNGELLLAEIAKENVQQDAWTSIVSDMQRKDLANEWLTQQEQLLRKRGFDDKVVAAEINAARKILDDDTKAYTKKMKADGAGLIDATAITLAKASANSLKGVAAMANWHGAVDYFQQSADGWNDMYSSSILLDQANYQYTREKSKAANPDEGVFEGLVQGAKDAWNSDSVISHIIDSVGYIPQAAVGGGALRATIGGAMKAQGVARVATASANAVRANRMGNAVLNFAGGGRNALASAGTSGFLAATDAAGGAYSAVMEMGFDDIKKNYIAQSSVGNWNALMAANDNNESKVKRKLAGEAARTAGGVAFAGGALLGASGIEGALTRYATVGAFGKARHTLAAVAANSASETLEEAWTQFGENVGAHPATGVDYMEGVGAAGGLGLITGGGMAAATHGAGSLAGLYQNKTNPLENGGAQGTEGSPATQTSGVNIERNINPQNFTANGTLDYEAYKAALGMEYTNMAQKASEVFDPNAVLALQQQVFNDAVDTPTVKALLTEAQRADLTEYLRTQWNINTNDYAQHKITDAAKAYKDGDLEAAKQLNNTDLVHAIRVKTGQELDQVPQKAMAYTRQLIKTMEAMAAEPTDVSTRERELIYRSKHLADVIDNTDLSAVEKSAVTGFVFSVLDNGSRRLDDGEQQAADKRKEIVGEGKKDYFGAAKAIADRAAQVEAENAAKQEQPAQEGQAAPAQAQERNRTKGGVQKVVVAETARHKVAAPPPSATNSTPSEEQAPNKDGLSTVALLNKRQKIVTEVAEIGKSSTADVGEQTDFSASGKPRSYYNNSTSEYLPKKGAAYAILQNIADYITGAEVYQNPKPFYTDGALSWSQNNEVQLKTAQGVYAITLEPHSGWVGPHIRSLVKLNNKIVASFIYKPITGLSYNIYSGVSNQPEVVATIEKLIDKIAASQNAISENLPTGPFTRDSGQIIKTKSVPAEMVDMVNMFLSQLDVKDLNLVIATRADTFSAEFVNDMGITLREAAMLYVDDVDAGGYTVPLYAKNDTRLLVYSDRGTREEQIALVLHELGHILETKLLALADEKTKLAVLAAYDAWFSRYVSSDHNQKNSTALAIEHIGRLRTAEAAKQMLDTSRGSSIQLRDVAAYWTSFAEWWADQTAKWATTDRKPLSIVEKFFAGAARRFKNLIYYVNKMFKSEYGGLKRSENFNFNADNVVREFYNSRLNSATQTLIFETIDPAFTRDLLQVEAELIAEPMAEQPATDGANTSETTIGETAGSAAPTGAAASGTPSKKRKKLERNDGAAKTGVNPESTGNAGTQQTAIPSSTENAAARTGADAVGTAGGAAQVHETGKPTNSTTTEVSSGKTAPTGTAGQTSEASEPVRQAAATGKEAAGSGGSVGASPSERDTGNGSQETATADSDVAQKQPIQGQPAQDKKAEKRKRDALQKREKRAAEKAANAPDVSVIRAPLELTRDPTDNLFARMGYQGYGHVIAASEQSRVMAQFAADLLQRLGVGGFNLVVADKNAITEQNADGAYPVLDALGLDADQRAKYLAKAQNPSIGGNSQSLYGDPNTRFVMYDALLPQAVQLEVLTHELGHILETKLLADAPQNTKQAIVAAYNKWLAQRGLNDTVDVFSARTAAALSTQRNKEFKLTPDQHYYVTSFPEWWANQVARWATTSEKPLTIVAKFFKGLAAMLQKLKKELVAWAKEPAQVQRGFSADFNADRAVSSFLNSRMSMDHTAALFSVLDTTLADMAYQAADEQAEVFTPDDEAALAAELSSEAGITTYDEQEQNDDNQTISTADADQQTEAARADFDRTGFGGGALFSSEIDGGGRATVRDGGTNEQSPQENGNETQQSAAASEVAVLNDQERSDVADFLAAQQDPRSPDEFVENALAARALAEENQDPTVQAAEKHGLIRRILDRLWNAVKNTVAAVSLTLALATGTTLVMPNTAQAAVDLTPTTGAVQMTRAAKTALDNIVRTNDNVGRNIVIADKKAGMLYLTDPTGKVINTTPALFGKSASDSQRTDGATGAGRYDLSYEQANIPQAGYRGSAQVFDRDGDNMFAIHRVVPVKGENRDGRLASPTGTDNRITHGCINVPAAFYDRHLDGDANAVLYVLPETQAGQAALGSLTAPTAPTVEQAAPTREMAAPVDKPLPVKAEQVQTDPTRELAKQRYEKSPARVVIDGTTPSEQTALVAPVQSGGVVSEMAAVPMGVHTPAEQRADETFDTLPVVGEHDGWTMAGIAVALAAAFGGAGVTSTGVRANRKRKRLTSKAKRDTAQADTAQTDTAQTDTTQAIPVQTDPQTAAAHSDWVKFISQSHLVRNTKDELMTDLVDSIVGLEYSLNAIMNDQSFAQFGRGDFNDGLKWLGDVTDGKRWGLINRFLRFAGGATPNFDNMLHRAGIFRVGHEADSAFPTVQLAQVRAKTSGTFSYLFRSLVRPLGQKIDALAGDFKQDLDVAERDVGNLATVQHILNEGAEHLFARRAKLLAELQKQHANAVATRNNQRPDTLEFDGAERVVQSIAKEINEMEQETQLMQDVYYGRAERTADVKLPGGYTQAEAQQVIKDLLAKYGKEGFARLEKLRGELVKATKAVTNYGSAHGIYTNEQLKTFKEIGFNEYVPLYRADQEAADVDENDVARLSRIEALIDGLPDSIARQMKSVKDLAKYTRAGATSHAADGYTNFKKLVLNTAGRIGMQGWTNALQQLHEGTLGKSMADAVITDPDTLKAINAQHEGKFPGLIRVRPSQTGNLPHELREKIGIGTKQALQPLRGWGYNSRGERVEYHYYFTERAVQNELYNNVHIESTIRNMLADNAGSLTRIAARFMTTFKPSWNVHNYLRDSVERWSIIFNRPVKNQEGKLVSALELTKTYAANLAKLTAPNSQMQKEIYAYMTNGTVKTPLQRVLHDAMSSGAVTMLTSATERHNAQTLEFGSAVDKGIEKAKALTSKLAGKTATNAATKAVEAYITVITEMPQIIVGLAAYKTYLDVGVNRREAANRTRDQYDPARVNGDLVRALSPFFPFIRSTLSGHYNTARTLTQYWGKGQRGKMIAFLTAGTAAFFMLAAMAAVALGDDEDGVPRMARLPLSDLLRGVPVPMGENGVVFAQLGFGLPRMLNGWGMALYKLAAGQTTAAEVATAMLQLLVDNTSPLQATGGAWRENMTAAAVMTVTPTLLLPVIEQAFNLKSYSGSQIIRGATPKEELDSEQDNFNTPEIYKDIAKGLNNFVGVDLRPETLHHYVDSYALGPFKVATALASDREEKTLGAQSVKADHAGVLITLLGADVGWSPNALADETHTWHLSALRTELHKRWRVGAKHKEADYAAYGVQKNSPNAAARVTEAKLAAAGAPQNEIDFIVGGMRYENAREKITKELRDAARAYMQDKDNPELRERLEQAGEKLLELNRNYIKEYQNAYLELL